VSAISLKTFLYSNGKSPHYFLNHILCNVADFVSEDTTTKTAKWFLICHIPPFFTPLLIYELHWEKKLPVVEILVAILQLNLF
jgi:hypothetical protein